MTARGYGFVTPQNGGKDLFVPKKSLNGAYHGDKVLFGRVRGASDEALILKVCARNPNKVVGAFVSDGRTSTVYPDDSLRPPVIVPDGLSGGAKNGQKVVCTVTRYFKNRLPLGKIEEILGEEGDLFAEELSVIRAHSLREEFGKKAAEEARNCLNEKLVAGTRRDLRDKNIFTIDGADTRDMDDAVSIELSGGKYVLGVHIADVSHYVGRGSALDAEAYERGASVYFPDRVIPMLPKELSNGICSLNEGADRYALSVYMTFGKDGERESFEIFESIINSRHKTTYPEITAVLGGDKVLCEKYADILDDIKLMQNLCLILERKRQAAGSIDLDLKEARIYLGGDGKIDIQPAQRTISERIIEQFMIAANEAVAEFSAKNKLPCLYRIHQSPSPDKTKDFSAFLKTLGINASFGGEIKPADFQKILKEAENKQFFPVVNKIMLRSMQKARYCGENKGHFGLASSCYCHFTSPIRRYPDLFVHRSVKLALKGEAVTAQRLNSPLLENAGTELSEKERIAEETERDVNALYKLFYMNERLGLEFDGIISGVTSNSVYCELSNTVEGVIPLEDLPRDSYEFVPEKHLLSGKKNKFRIGDKVRVRVTSCDFGRMKTILRICMRICN